MIAEFEKQHIDKIILDESNDWFSARLLRLMFYSTKDKLQQFKPEFVEEFNLISRFIKKGLIDRNEYSEQVFDEKLEFLLAKSDQDNFLKLIRCFPHIAKKESVKTYIENFATLI